MSRMTKMKPKIQRTSGSAVSTNPASALDAIINKFAEMGLGGQDGLLEQRRMKAKLIDAKCSPKSLFSDYVHVKTPNKIKNYARMTPSGTDAVPSASRVFEFPAVESPPPFRKIIDRIIREGKKEIA